MKQQETISLFDRKRETQTQQFIKIYQGLKAQGALDEEKIFETSVDLLQQQRQQMKADSQEATIENVDEQKFSLSEAFNEAKETKENSEQNKSRETKNEKSTNKNSIGGIDIQNLFKD